MKSCLFGENPGPALFSSIRQSVRKIFRRDRKAEPNTLEVSADTEHPPWNPAETEPLERHSEVRDFLQTFKLSRNEDYLIHPSVCSIRMGLGWDRDADVDASVALFDDQKDAVDTVRYDKPRSECHNVTHSGDGLTGSGEGGGETIAVELASLPPDIRYLLFAACIRSQNVSLRQIQSVYVRMMHSKERDNNQGLCHFSLTDMSGNVVVMGALTRKGPYWNFRALGIPATGRTIQELLQNPQNLECLHANPSYRPDMRQVIVNVIKGRDLAAKDTVGFFKKRYSSDPYYIITFKNKQYTSEYIRRTLEPEWKSYQFEMDLINEVETKALKVQIFDYDAIGADQFMGMIWIPGHALYRLGLGCHTFWFKLESSKEPEYRHEAVSGEILIQFRVKGSGQDLEICSEEGRESDQIAPVPQDSGARADIGETERVSSLNSVDQRLPHAHLTVRRERSVPAFTDSEKNTAGEIRGEVIHRSATVPENKQAQERDENETDEEMSCATTHREERQMEVASHPAEPTETEHCQSTSDEGDSSSSEAEIWIPDAPYGSRGRLLTAVSALKKGQHFTDDYTIMKHEFDGKPHLRLAQHKIGKKELVVLKFYWEEAKLEHTIELHSEIASSENVCRIVQTMKTANTGHPPCLVFERGTHTLCDWLRSDRSLIDRTWCLSQILTGLKDLHDKGIVHCGVNPTNVMFFSESVTWKITNLDRAQKAGEGRVGRSTVSYAAPEVLRGWQEEEELPITQPSVDIWSCGILAYELLTGDQMFSDDLTEDEIFEFVLEGKIEEKLNWMEDRSHQDALSKFLKFDPNERWSAAKALQDKIFQSDPQTTTTE